MSPRIWTPKSVFEKWDKTRDIHKQYSAAFKATVVREVLGEAKPLSQIAAAYGVHPSVVTQWRDQALVGLTEGEMNHAYN